MGILNLTPDSFSDGAIHRRIDDAVDHALRMTEQGADIIDIGGESTRPGAERISAEEQKRRVVATIERLRAALPVDVPISIDTTSADVAAKAVHYGATIINDVSAGRDDPAMFRLAAEHGCYIVLMHMQGTPQTMQTNPMYLDVVSEVEAFLLERARQAETEGVQKQRIWLDPGIGFGKSSRHNLALLARLDRFVDTGYRVVLGASRKRFMGKIVREQDPSKLVPATCVTTALGVLSGASVFRVHDVVENRQAADVAWAIRNLSTRAPRGADPVF